MAPAPDLPAGGVFTGEYRLIRAASRWGIRPGEIDAIDPGEMAMMVAADELMRAEERAGRTR